MSTGPQPESKVPVTGIAWHSGIENAFFIGAVVGFVVTVLGQIYLFVYPDKYLQGYWTTHFLLLQPFFAPGSILLTILAKANLRIPPSWLFYLCMALGYGVLGSIIRVIINSGKRLKRL
jgi:hypothetical protein